MPKDVNKQNEEREARKRAAEQIKKDQREQELREQEKKAQEQREREKKAQEQKKLEREAKFIEEMARHDWEIRKKKIDEEEAEKKKQQAEEERRRNNPEPDYPNDISRMIDKAAANVPEDAGEKEWRNALDKAFVLKTMARMDYIKTDGDEIKPEKAKEEDIGWAAEELRDTILDPMYKAVRDSMNKQELQEAARNPGLFIDNLSNVKKHYTKVSDVSEMEKHVSNLALNHLVSTGTGKDALGATRSKNSAEYENMITAMRNTVGGYSKDASPLELAARDYKAVEATKKYIETHKSPRRTKTGRERFNMAMAILAAKMPRNEFEEYVNNLNVERGARSGEKNYLDAKQFIATTPEREIASERDELERMRFSSYEYVTKEQAAKIAALYELNAEEVPGQKEFRLNQKKPISLADLNRKTEEILRNDSFEAWYKKTPQKDLQNALQENPAKIGFYKHELRQMLNKEEARAEREKINRENESKRQEELKEQEKARKQKEADERRAEQRRLQERKALENRLRMEELKKRNPDVYNALEEEKEEINRIKEVLETRRITSNVKSENDMSPQTYRANEEQLQRRKDEYEAYRQAAVEVLKGFDAKKAADEYLKNQENERLRDEELKKRDPKTHELNEKYKNQMNKLKKELESGKLSKEASDKKSDDLKALEEGYKLVEKRVNKTLADFDPQKIQNPQNPQKTGNEVKEAQGAQLNDAGRNNQPTDQPKERKSSPDPLSMTF